MTTEVRITLCKAKLNGSDNIYGWIVRCAVLKNTTDHEKKKLLVTLNILLRRDSMGSTHLGSPCWGGFGQLYAILLET